MGKKLSIDNYQLIIVNFLSQSPAQACDAALGTNGEDGERLNDDNQVSGYASVELEPPVCCT